MKKKTAEITDLPLLLVAAWELIPEYKVSIRAVNDKVYADYERIR